MRFCLLIRHVTLTFDLLTLNSWRTWQVTWLTLPPSLNTLCLSVLDLWVITFPFGYHWECVRGHCACAESRDPWVGGQKQLHFWNPRPRFAYSLYNFFWATTTIKGRLLSSVTNAKSLYCVNFVRDLVTLTFDLLIFNIYDTWRATWSTLPPSLKTLWIFFHELRVITFPIDYHWKYVRRPFCFMQIIRWKLKIWLGNRAHRIQHASVMLKTLVPHFYPKMHLDDCWRPFFRNPSRL